MSVRPIPEGSVEIQTGLWLLEIPYMSGGIQKIRYELYSAEGYCFWEVNQPENYDEEGNLKPLEQRVFAQYASLPYIPIDELNTLYISVPIQDGYEIVSVGDITS